MIILKGSCRKTPLKVPAAPAETGCVAVFPPWRVALNRRCTGLKRSTQKAVAFSMLMGIIQQQYLNISTKVCDGIDQKVKNMVFDLFS